MENIKISIVVPIYNQEYYLDTSIPSLLNQTYRNLEIILVNDGSKDLSGKIIKKYQKLDDRIKVITKSNGGLVDATICGLENLNGDYVAFLDPDDRVGEDFVENFIKELDDSTEIDVLAMGYYFDDGGMLTPYYLKESRVYDGRELKDLQKNFIYESGLVSISNRIFISRWNKLYKRQVLLPLIEKFRKCKDVSLGEDTIFTSLMLQEAKKIKVVSYPNSYFYNISNQKSMMNSEKVLTGVQKSKVAYKKINEIVNVEKKQSLALYFFLIESLYQKEKNSFGNSFKVLHNFLKNDVLYKDSIGIFIKDKNVDYIKRCQLKLRLLLNANIYIFFSLLLLYVKKVVKFIFKDIIRQIKNVPKKGLYKTLKEEFHRKKRISAYIDLKSGISDLDKKISPILSKYIGKEVPLKETKLEKNIFIFWWDGFERSPMVVKRCLASVRKYYSDANIVEISKYNFKDYTDINPVLVKDFYNGNISIQTFSDILRFNLLKNHGGIWIDATILFFNKIDLFQELEDKSFSTIYFSSSRNFLKYKDNSCSWSGYFIAARKGSYLVTVMNNLFEEYYLQYGNYPFYFFIDALFMICKINNIDDSVLSKTLYIDADMFLLMKLLDKEYNHYSLSLISQIPQKLTWFCECKSNLNNSFYQKMILENYEE
ncbi:capsular polysaccharide synthesis protein [Streptococcus sp.]